MTTGLVEMDGMIKVEAIASAIRHAMPLVAPESPESRVVRECIAVAIAQYAAATNPRFDKPRFFAACRVKGIE